MPVSQPGSRLVAVLAAAIGLVLLGVAPASALAEPAVPEPVATYVSQGLLPRIADLYGPGKTKGSGITIDANTKVGPVHRVMAFTTDYLAGRKTDTSIEFTNNWVVAVRNGDTVVGLATIWINPASDQPELATFALGAGLVVPLETAPAENVLVRDDARNAWFATDGTTLTPLVPGTSSVTKPTTLTEYQKTASTPLGNPGDALNQGLVIAGVVLGLVVIGLALFVLLPSRRPKKPAAN